MDGFLELLDFLSGEVGEIIEGYSALGNAQKNIEDIQLVADWGENATFDDSVKLAVAIEHLHEELEPLIKKAKRSKKKGAKKSD